MIDTTLEKLIITRAYVARGFSKGALARDAEGRKVRADDPAAVAWSLAGAIFRATSDTTDVKFPARLAIAIQNDADLSGPIELWGDKVGQAGVLEVLDDLIEKMQGAQS